MNWGSRIICAPRRGSLCGRIPGNFCSAGRSSSNTSGGFLRRQDSDTEKRLLGCWHPIRVEGTSQLTDADELDFRSDGQLISSSKTGPTWEVNRLVYHLEGSVIVSSDNVRIGFAFGPDGTLRLDTYDKCIWYKRGPKEAPEP